MINQRFDPFRSTVAARSAVRPTESNRHNPFIFIALALAVLASLTQAGCTGLTSANAPADPTNTTTAAVAGASGVFGSVATGSSANQTFTVSNTGTVTLTITQLAVSGTGFSVSGLTLPASVNPGQGASFAVRFAPSTAGAVTGSISMTANTNPAVSMISLTGTGTSGAQPVLSVSPTNISFGGVGLGQNVGAAMSVTNAGSGTLTISNISVAGAGFSLSAVSMPITLTAGQSTNLIANINTTTVGNISGSVTFTNNSTTPSLVVPLSGTGMAAPGQPAISVAPTSFDFGTVAVGVSSTHTFTISNSGTSALSISNISVAGTGFSISGFALPISVPANGSTTIAAKFTPAAAGAVGGNFTITNNSPTPSIAVALNGTGAAAGQPLIATNPTSVAFGNVIIGSPNSQTILIQNTGTATLTISSASATGTGFSINGLTVPATIAGGGSTTFNVAFAPATAGTVSGSVSLVSNAVASPTAIPLSGTGVAKTMLLAASSTNLPFGNVAVGSNNSQPVTLTNNGNSTVTIGTVSTTGTGFSASGVTAGQTIGAGQTASLSVKFAPASTAAVSGTVTVTSNATNSPINISVSGTGTTVVAHSVSLAWTASTSSVVGYNVYRSTISGGPYTLVTTTAIAGVSYTDSTVQAGVTYFYVVTAVDSNGNESAFSNEAPVTVPTP
jgi:hypothetical protein